MALPALVLVHGGGHAADCWDPAIDEIHRCEPGLEVLAVDLPGRRSRPGDLRTLTIADWVQSVVRDIESAGLDEIVIAGHSLAGITIPGVAARLGPSRVRELVFAAAFVPPEGRTVTDTVGGLAGMIARRRRRAVEAGAHTALVREVLLHERDVALAAPVLARWTVRRIRHDHQRARSSSRYARGCAADVDSDQA